MSGWLYSFSRKTAQRNKGSEVTVALKANSAERHLRRARHVRAAPWKRAAAASPPAARSRGRFVCAKGRPSNRKSERHLHVHRAALRLRLRLRMRLPRPVLPCGSEGNKNTKMAAVADWHVLRRALRHFLRRVLYEPALHVSTKSKRGGQHDGCWFHDACHDEHLHDPVLRGAQYVLRHVPRRVPHSLSFTCYLFSISFK